PKMHPPRPVGVEVDGEAVRRILRAIIQSLGRRQARLRSAGGGDGVDVELAIALAAKGERLAVWRPAVPVGRAVGRDEVRSAAGDRQRVDERLPPALRLIADDQLRAVRETPWSLLQRLAKPVSIASGVPPVAGMR